MQAQEQLTIHLLGPVSVRAADGRDLTPPGKKLRTLLACLALSGQRGWSRERLCTLLWGDRSDEQARASLRQALAELRRLLGEPSPLKTDHDIVAFDTTSASVDAVDFVQLAGSDKLLQAAALYRGEFLEDLSPSDTDISDWLTIERTRLREVAIDVLVRLVGSQAPDAAIQTAQQLLHLDPLREETYRTLMRLYSTGGQRAQALRQYQICSDTLQRQLGVKPEIETERLYQQIKSSNGGAAPSRAERPTAVETVDENQDAASGTRANKPVRTRRWVAALIAGVIVASGSIVAGYSSWTSTRGVRNAASAEAAIGLPVILVLPFQDLTVGNGQSELGRGIAEDLRDLLWHSPEFQIISDTSRMLSGTHPKDTRAMAQQYGAHFIITGGIRQAGQRTVITAQLIDGGTGVHLWSDRFEEAIDNPVDLEKVVAGRLSSALGGMTGSMKHAYERVAWNKTESELTEYDYYARGHSLHHTFKKEEVLRARDIYQAGLDRYPESVLLRAKLSLVYVTGLWRWSEDVEADAAKIRHYAREAATLMEAKRPTRFEEYYVHWTSAYADHLDRNYARCRLEAEAAIRLNQYDALLNADLAFQMVECGDPGRGVLLAREAMRQEPDGLPDNPDFYKSALTWALYFADQCEEAIEVAKSMNDPPLMTIAACQVRLGSIGAGKATMATFARTDPEWTIRDEAFFPFQMVEPLQRRWLDDIRAAGLPN